MSVPFLPSLRRNASPTLPAAADAAAAAPTTTTGVAAAPTDDPATPHGSDAAADASAPLTASVPQLPDAATVPASPAATLAALLRLQRIDDVAAYAILAEGQRQTLKLTGTVRRVSQLGAAQHSLASIRHLVAQIAGERRSAVTKLGGSFGALGSSYVAGTKGFALQRSADEGQQAKGAGLYGAAQQLGGVVASVVDAADKADSWLLWRGGAAMADEARVAQREDDHARNLLQQLAESARSAYDQADRALAAALQAFVDYFKRKEALSNTIAGR